MEGCGGNLLSGEPDSYSVGLRDLASSAGSTVGYSAPSMLNKNSS